MNQIQIGSFRRINRTRARNLYEAGKTVYLCPCNMPPTSMWVVGISKPANDSAVDTLFDSRVNAFAYYNHNDVAGHQTFFYENV